MMRNNENGHVPYAERFGAQQAILGPFGMQKIRDAVLFIAGAGGLGSNVAICAARAGFQKIYQCDPQVVEPDNLNRIFAADRHVGRHKVAVVAEHLVRFDRFATDEHFTYTPLPFAVEHETVRLHLKASDVIICCTNSAASRRWLLSYAIERHKMLLNAGVACAPGAYFSGEVSVYRPGRANLGCPACISLMSPEDGKPVADPLFHPPLAMLAGLAVHLVAAELTNFDLLGEERPNYFSLDALGHTLSALRVSPDPACTVCRGRGQEIKLALAAGGHS